MWDDCRRTRQPFRNQDAVGALSGLAPGGMWELGGELVKHPGTKSVGLGLGWRPGALLVQQVTEPLTELVKRLRSLASSKSRSRLASCACCTSNSLVFSMGKGLRPQGAAPFICQTRKSCGPEKNAVCRSGSAVRPMEDSRHDCEPQLCVVCLTGGKHGGGFCPRAENTAAFCPGRGCAG